MPDTNVKNVENTNQKDTPKKHSFFGGEINAKTKDLLDFRYNTQEEIDKLNEEMTTTDDLDEIIQQNDESNENVQNKNEDLSGQEGDKKSEGDLDNDLESINDSKIDDNYISEKEPIEGDLIDEPQDIENKEDDKVNETVDTIEELNNEEKETENEEVEENNEDETGDSVKFFDPFELNLDEDEDDENQGKPDEEIFDPFGLNEEENNKKEVKQKDEVNEQDDEEIEQDVEQNIEQDVEQNVEQDDDQDDEQDDDQDDEQDVEQDDKQDDEQDDEQDVEDVEQDVEQNVEDVEQNVEDVEQNVEDVEQNVEDVEQNVENIMINTPISINPNKKNKKEIKKNEKIKKSSVTGEIVTNEEIQLEQGQDMPNTEDKEEYKPSAEEIFEREPEFFANDELSQQFMQLVMNVRGIFKLERKDGEQNPYFKIIGGKTEESTLEYLFYLIEEEDEPIDLYIKKIETNQGTEEEDEHLVQFSYNEEKELNIFVDEVILYDKINKSDSNDVGYNDTKSILEKFIFLTENHYNKIKTKMDKQREEKEKKRQLQQIFKGF